MPSSPIPHAASFRDPSGFIFEKDGIIYRQVNKVYAEHFDFFIQSGCYDALINKQMLIRHETAHPDLPPDENAHVFIRPERIQFISYPYEWGFDMLRDAALLTLELLKEGLEWGMILKDATPYNIQWHDGKLVWIDSLSYEKYNPEEPWIAYRQFCESFLSPLLIAHYTRQPVQDIMLAYPEGIPLMLTSSLLPWKSQFSLHTYLHIHLHAKYSSKSNIAKTKKLAFSRQKLLNLIRSLEVLIRKLRLPGIKSTWSLYYDEASQRPEYLKEKQKIIEQWVAQIQPLKNAADLGANTGEFSRLLAAKNIKTISADSDPFCINALYKQIKTGREKNIIPLVIDLSKPSPAIGLNNDERNSFTDRCQVDLVLALALIHHLSIGKNIPFEKTAVFFQKICHNLIIEFVPKDDEKVQQMLLQKKDIYTGYSELNFVDSFRKFFSIKASSPVGSSGRTLFLMERI